MSSSVSVRRTSRNSMSPDGGRPHLYTPRPSRNTRPRHQPTPYTIPKSPPSLQQNPANAECYPGPPHPPSCTSPSGNPLTDPNKPVLRAVGTFRWSETPVPHAARLAEKLSVAPGGVCFGRYTAPLPLVTKRRAFLVVGTPLIRTGDTT